MKDPQLHLHSLDDEATQNQLAVVRWSQIHHRPVLPSLLLHVHGYSHAILVLPDHQQAHHRKEIPEIHEDNLVVRMDLQRSVENEGNPRNVENSCDGVVIGKLQQDFEGENSEKRQVGFPKVESE
jgi:hypothetical protein